MTLPDVLLSRPQDRELLAVLAAIVAVGVFVGAGALLVLRALFSRRSPE